ncbi:MULTISPECIES: glycosyltransferase [Lachnospiraceae]|uniref:glycosyltransferase n=1 Tax=Lachnospiraceae TaxID=186803 RepID=UPI00189CE0AB|nr:MULTISPECIES: glycosyltransferase [Lachnospiraceae]
MRIAMMTNNYKPFVGGVPISIERLANSLRALGNTVYIFAPDYKSSVPDDEYTFRFPTMQKKIAGAVPVPCPIYHYVKGIIQTLDIDLIHVHHPVLIGNAATRLGKELQIPVVFTYHTRYEQYLHYLKPLGYLQSKANEGCVLGKLIIGFVQEQIVQRYLKYFIKKCDMVFAPTESIYKHLKQYGFYTPVNIAPTGLPENSFEAHPAATKIRQQYLQGKKYLFCTVSRLAKEKNLSFILQGIAKAKKQSGDIFNVIIIGDGPDKNKLLNQSANLGIDKNVFFVGEVPNQMIADYHQACDLFLFSSKSETQGIVLLEAMAAFLPVIAISATGVSDVVENGRNGILSTDSTEEWGRNLVYVMENRNVLTGMKMEARKTALRYNEKIIAARILNYYQALQKNHQAEQWLYNHLGRNYQTILLKENY